MGLFMRGGEFSLPKKRIGLPSEEIANFSLKIRALFLLLKCVSLVLLINRDSNKECLVLIFASK